MKRVFPSIYAEDMSYPLHVADLSSSAMKRPCSHYLVRVLDYDSTGMEAEPATWHSKRDDALQSIHMFMGQENFGILYELQSWRTMASLISISDYLRNDQALRKRARRL